MDITGLLPHWCRGNERFEVIGKDRQQGNQSFPGHHRIVEVGHQAEPHEHFFQGAIQLIRQG
jgi:hypothetical protein